MMLYNTPRSNNSNFVKPKSESISRSSKLKVSRVQTNPNQTRSLFVWGRLPFKLLNLNYISHLRPWQLFYPGPSLVVLCEWDASLPWLAPTMFLNFNYLLIAGSGPGSAYSQPTQELGVKFGLRPDNKLRGCPWHKSSRLLSDGITLVFIRRSEHVFSSAVICPTLYIQLPKTDRGYHIFEVRGNSLSGN